MKNHSAQEFIAKKEDRSYLIAKYFLGQISASELAFRLRCLNSVSAYYEIQRSKKNLLALTNFKDVPNGKPGEQLAQTVTDLRPVSSAREARYLLNSETCEEKRTELKRVIYKDRVHDMQNKVNIMNQLDLVILHCSENSKQTLHILRQRFLKGLKIIRNGSFNFSNFKEFSQYIVNRIKAVLSINLKKFKTRRLGQGTMHVNNKTGNIKNL